MKSFLSLATLAAALGLAQAAAAFCPSYSPDSASNSNDCGVASFPGTNPTTAEWQPIFDLVSQGPAVWGTKGPSVTDIGQGCNKPEPLHSVPARFPCELLKAITMVESGWRQFCVPDQPSDQVGGPSRTIISFDCGYGVGQVTSGMHTGENPGFDRDRVASDPTYNLATGTRILASKWKATECVGDNQPTIIEHWYSATWAYNGLAYVNNPNNPNYDPNRGVYNPSAGGGAPYQEKVFGRMEYTGGQWGPTKLAYPNLGDIGSDGSPNSLPEPNCASPTDCGNHRSTHPTSCNGTGGTGGTGGTTSTGSTSTGTGTGGNGNTGAGGAMNGGSGGEAQGGAGSDEGGAGGAGGKDGGKGGSGKDFKKVTDEGGCGCRAVGGETGGEAWGLVAAIALALARRRRVVRPP